MATLFYTSLHLFSAHVLISSNFIYLLLIVSEGKIISRPDARYFCQNNWKYLEFSVNVIKWRKCFSVNAASTLPLLSSGFVSAILMSALFGRLGKLNAVSLPPGGRDAFSEEVVICSVLIFYF